MRMKDKITVVTGAGHGIGRAIALEFAKEGADVAILDINVETAQDTEREVEKLGRRGLAIYCDVTDPNQASSSMRKIVDEFGTLDVLVNNAGIALAPCSSEKYKLEDWNRELAVNLTAPFILSQTFANILIEQKKSGKIINVSSIAGLGGVPSFPAYTASKHGLVGLTKTLALDFAKYKINVNCLCVGGPVQRSGQWEEYSCKYPELAATRAKKIPVKRLPDPEDMARAAVYLAVEDYVTGITLPVDGGQTCILSTFVDNI